ncbi:MAG: glycosyltransferase [Candidatus Yanofskybacteria bacterium]|nr:glycosyltransferase [Candidatus Yanofskybacteria bacterium]
MSQMTFDGNQNEMASQTLKKRVLFVITQSEIGGAQQFLARFLSLLNQEKFDYMVAAGSDGAQELKDLLPGQTPYFAVKNLRRNPSLSQDIKAVFELKKILLEYRPDILFLLSSKAGFLGSYAAKKAAKELPSLKVIYRIGGWTFNDPWGGFKKRFYRFLEKRSAPWKDYIVVNSSSDLKTAQELNFKPRKELLLIHNGIDPYMEFLERNEAREKLIEIAQRTAIGQENIPLDDKHIVGTIANLYPAKGISNLIRAAAQSDSQTVFFIIGDGMLRPQLEKEIASSGLQQKVFLLGKLENAHKYIPGFDVFFLPSVKEGFPWVILEAMAAKVPVIASSVGAVPEVINSYQSGILVRPGQPEQVIEAIKAVRSNEALRKEIIIQAHQTIIKNFALRPMVEQYEQLFNA